MPILVQTSEKGRKGIEEQIDKKQYIAFIANFTYFHYNYDRLKEEYPDEYVAVYEKQIVDHDADLDTLMERLKEKWGDLRAFVIEYISASKVELIL
jgi:hypothetical protein